MGFSSESLFNSTCDTLFYAGPNNCKKYKLVEKFIFEDLTILCSGKTLCIVIKLIVVNIVQQPFKCVHIATHLWGFLDVQAKSAWSREKQTDGEAWNTHRKNHKNDMTWHSAQRAKLQIVRTLKMFGVQLHDLARFHEFKRSF